MSPITPRIIDKLIGCLNIYSPKVSVNPAPNNVHHMVTGHIRHSNFSASAPVCPGGQQIPPHRCHESTPDPSSEIAY